MLGFDRIRFLEHTLIERISVYPENFWDSNTKTCSLATVLDETNKVIKEKNLPLPLIKLL